MIKEHIEKRIIELEARNEEIIRIGNEARKEGKAVVGLHPEFVCNKARVEELRWVLEKIV